MATQGELFGFVSYAHSDASAIETLEQNLTAIELTLPVRFWRDPALTAGSSPQEVISDKILCSSIFVLALSQSFLSRPFITGTELPAILARAKAIDGLVVPIILENCLWERFVDFNLTPAPLDSHQRLLPVDKWPSKDGYYAAASQLADAICRKFGLVSKTPLSALTQNKAALTFDAKRVLNKPLDQATIIVDAPIDDKEAAASTIVRQMQAITSRHLKVFLDQCASPGISNAAGWLDKIEALREVDQIVSGTSDALADNLGTLWMGLQSVHSSISFDLAMLDRGIKAEDPPLTDVQRNALTEIAMNLGALLGNFPSIRYKIIPGRMAAADGGIPSGQAIAFFRFATDRGLLDEESGRFLGIMMKMSNGNDQYAARLRTFLDPSSINLGLFVLAFAAISSVSAHPSPLQIKARAILMDVEGNTLLRNITSGIPELHSIIGRAETLAKPFSAEIPEPGPIGRARPFNVNEAQNIKEIILQGRAIPEHLLNEIIRLDLSDTPFSDLNSISRLKKLQNLRLDRTLISDLSPLNGLTELSVLSIGYTKVVDLSPLAKLTTLQSLTLDGITADDFYPVNRLTVLHSLSVRSINFGTTTIWPDALNIRSLYLDGANIRNLDFLPRYSKLQLLSLLGVEIPSLSWLAEMDQLQVVIARLPYSKIERIKSMLPSGWKISNKGNIRRGQPLRRDKRTN